MGSGFQVSNIQLLLTLAENLVCMVNRNTLSKRAIVKLLDREGNLE